MQNDTRAAKIVNLGNSVINTGQFDKISVSHKHKKSKK